jgi:hypothetical protein
MSHAHRLPVSTRHAFALAFDLAFRRDPLHSLIIPLLLRAPWAVAAGMLPTVDVEAGVPARVLMGASLILLGDFLTLLVVSAMLRLRARSVFNTAAHVAPMPVGECYRRGFRRIPWLVVTEVVRNFLLGLAASFAVIPARLLRLTLATFMHDLGRNLMLIVIAGCLILPFLLLGCRLGVATECVVLDEHDLSGAFIRSWRLMGGRLERWFELILGSAGLVLAVALMCAVFTLAVPALTGPSGVTALWLLIIFVTPVIQYAWTFFYLRLVEVDVPADQLPGEAGAAAPRPAPALRLVSPAGSPSEPEDPAES